MKWVLVLIVIAGAVYFWMKSQSGGPAGPPDTPMGVCNYFIDAARAGDMAKIDSVTLPEKQATARRIAGELQSLWPDGLIMKWQNTDPTLGADHAYTGQITGRGKMLVVEIKDEGSSQYKIFNVVLADQ
jgi:hypothetical protein